MNTSAAIPFLVEQVQKRHEETSRDMSGSAVGHLVELSHVRVDEVLFIVRRVA